MRTTTKPDRHSAMQLIIAQTRAVIPFGLSEAQLCSGICHGCSKKLLNFLEMELDDWEAELNRGEVPKLGDIQSLAKTSKKIYRALKRSGLLSLEG